MLDERRMRAGTTLANLFMAGFILLLLVLCANLFGWIGFH
jgi:hypothetical protein